MTDSSATDDAVVIERTFDAPASTIWQMWTDPEHFRAWYGPMGATIPTAEMDVSVGGKRLIAMQMQTPNGEMTMWFTGEYLEVDPTNRLVYTESMADETGRILSPADMGMPAGHPETTEVVVELEDLGTRTRMLLTHRGIPADSPGAMGWNMALDKLETYVAGR
jgi:uncharacterized protein YndB with AHSA1/START domain